MHDINSFGNQASGFNRGPSGNYGRSHGLLLTYTNGPVELRVMYDELRDANGRFSNVFVSSRELFVGAAVDLQGLTLQLGYNHLTAPDTAPGLAHTADQMWAGGKYKVSRALLLQAAVFHVRVGSGEGDAAHDESGHATMNALGGLYYLSRTTVLYTTIAHIRNGRDSNFGFGVINPGFDKRNPDDPMVGHSRSGAYFGIVRSF